MMKELSMHIQDIAENSIRGDAKEIIIRVKEQVLDNIFSFEIIDNGRGIPEEILKDIKNPFTTTRKHRKVGLGIPFLNETCITCGGKLILESQMGVGTTVIATMIYNHIDRPPLGNLRDTLTGLITSYQKINIIFEYMYNQEIFSLTTAEIVEVLGEEVNLGQIEVIQWLRNTLTESIEETRLSK